MAASPERICISPHGVQIDTQRTQDQEEIGVHLSSDHSRVVFESPSRVAGHDDVRIQDRRFVPGGTKEVAAII